MVHYDSATHLRWVADFSELIDHEAPDGQHRADGRRVDRYWPVGIYIATRRDIVEYVGSVCRTGEDGYDARFTSHHMPVETWEHIWLLPFLRGTRATLLHWAESKMIAALRPRTNTLRPAPWIIGRRVMSRD